MGALCSGRAEGGVGEAGLAGIPCTPVPILDFRRIQICNPVQPMGGHMNTKLQNPALRVIRRTLGPALLAAAVVLVAVAQAPAFQLYNGESVQARLDTTVSYGLQWRVQDRDGHLVGIANGGRAFGVNGDDGNLNYDKGLVSNVVKVTSELDLRSEHFGAFVRGSAFYDFENMNQDRERTDLTDEAEDLVGKDAEILDRYAWTSFNLGRVPLQFRVGDQVVSWGESTFIQNSINTINPVNVSAIRLPGAELREALVPEGMVWGSVALTADLTVEGLYLYDWEETVIDPPGSYFSSTDIAGDGGQKVLLGFGKFPDNGNASFEDTFQAVSRSGTRRADDSGQYGLAARIFVPALNQTEFGLYYLNYHSRLPVISSRTGTLQGAAAASTIGSTSGPAVAGTVLAGGSVEQAVQVGESLGMTTQQATNVAVQVDQGGPAAAPGAITESATDAFAKTASYFTEYPEDIKLFGASFNTEIGATGIALQGEVSHRWDAPLQVDDLELLFATLGPINIALAEGNQIGNTFMQFDQEIQGYIERDVTQAQATVTKLFGPGIGADQTVLVGEVGYTYVHNLPKKNEKRMEVPGTYISGNADLSFAHGIAAGQVEPSSAFADAHSWGYRLVGRMDFNNAVGPINLFPRIAWQHDVSGNTPGPGGNFLEGRKAITYGLGGTYLEAWSADLSYTNFFGAGRQNLTNDRDFVAFNVKYSF
jgi:hypothetical protein